MPTNHARNDTVAPVAQGRAPTGPRVTPRPAAG